MLVHVIFEDLEALNDLPSHVHTAAFADRADAAHYVSCCAQEILHEADNPKLTCEYTERGVTFSYNNQWIGCLEIREVDVQ